jgi:hypothetical protein
LFVKQSAFVYVPTLFRSGKKVDNNNSEGENTHTTRSRPLLITFSNESVKKTLFQNVSKLRDITGELAAVSVDHNMTPKKQKTMVEVNISCWFRNAEHDGVILSLFSF